MRFYIYTVFIYYSENFPLTRLNRSVVVVVFAVAIIRNFQCRCVQRVSKKKIKEEKKEPMCITLFSIEFDRDMCGVLNEIVVVQ